MKLLPIRLPSGRNEVIQILACHYTADSAGLWVLLCSPFSRTLIYCTPHSSESRFVLPSDFVYLGSSRDGSIFFLVDQESAGISPLYTISYVRNSGITVSNEYLDCRRDQYSDLLKLCRAPRSLASTPTLHDSPLLHDNAYSISTQPFVYAPYHSLHDVLSIRVHTEQLSRWLPSQAVLVKSNSCLKASYPYLWLVDSLVADADLVALIANDSSVKTLACGAESRLFISTGSTKPSLSLGRSLFSIDNALSVSPPASDLIHPSLGLVLAPSALNLSHSSTSQDPVLCVYSINYVTTSLYRSNDCGHSFELVRSIDHRNQDLVPLTFHHIDCSQTLMYASRTDRSSVYIIEPTIAT